MEKNLNKLTKLALLVIIVLLFLNLKSCRQKVDTLQYFDVDIKGMNGFAAAKVIIDEEALKLDISQKAKLSTKSMGYMFKISDYIDNIHYDIEPNENLKNGDVLTLSVSITGKDKGRVKLLGGKKKFVVKDLVDGKEIDIFKDLDISFSGVSPNASVKLYNNSNDDFIKNIKFKIQPNSKLKIGDKLNITAKFDEKKANENMYIIKNKSKEIIVEDIDFYLDDVSKIDKKTKIDIFKESDDIINSYLEKNTAKTYNDLAGEFSFAKNEEFGYAFELESANLKVAKHIDAVGFGKPTNQIVIFYNLNLKKLKDDKKISGYIALTLDNIIVRQDKSIDIVYLDAKVVNSKKRKDDIIRQNLTEFKGNYNIYDIGISYFEKSIIKLYEKP